ncbi:hypothetical protein FRC08_005530 [Ceratobasidium sp. 394]|nr:hypothetical protein FRC08_005530 [Ceratobasidium sp. 394]
MSGNFLPRRPLTQLCSGTSFAQPLVPLSGSDSDGSDLELDLDGNGVIHDFEIDPDNGQAVSPAGRRGQQGRPELTYCRTIHPWGFYVLDCLSLRRWPSTATQSHPHPQYPSDIHDPKQHAAQGQTPFTQIFSGCFDNAQVFAYA